MKLADIVQKWLSEAGFAEIGGLTNHYYIKHTSGNNRKGYLACDCDVDFVFIGITSDSIELFRPALIISASDPKFFDIIHKWIVEFCGLQRHLNIKQLE